MSVDFKCAETSVHTWGEKCDARAHTRATTSRRKTGRGGTCVISRKASVVLHLFLTIKTAAPPAATPAVHSEGCKRVLLFAWKLCDIVLPATSRLLTFSTVNARKGM